MKTELDEVKEKFNELIKSKSHDFNFLDKSIVPVTQGIYFIYNNQNQLAHVGRTLRGKNGLRQRLGNHFSGKSSFVRNYLRGNREALRNGYTYCYVEVRDNRIRALLESYAIGMLGPLHLGLGSD